MRVHAANGDRVAIRRVYDDHLRTLEALDFDGPHESMTNLLDHLVELRA